MIILFEAIKNLYSSIHHHRSKVDKHHNFKELRFKTEPTVDLRQTSYLGSVFIQNIQVRPEVC